MLNITRNKDVGKAGNPGQFAAPTLNGGIPATVNDFTDTLEPATGPNPTVPTYEDLRGKRNPLNGHPTVGAISLAYDPRTPDGVAPEFVEVAFFDKAGQWISDRPVPGFEAWDEGNFGGDTRVYPGVPFGYVQAWVSVDGDEEQLRDRVAAELHDNWRAGRSQLDGSIEPRWKDDGNGGSVDIANTPFNELPDTWKAENRASAQSVMRCLLSDPYADDDEVATVVHSDWLTRNSAWAEPQQLGQYSELPEIEKRKDLEVVWAARRVLGIHSD